MNAKRTTRTLTPAFIALLLSTTAQSAAVTTQTKPFHVHGTLPAVCFKADVDSALKADGSLPPGTGAAAASLLNAALAFSVADFDAFGALQIQRHGNNGAVFHLDWGALLSQASLSLAATTTNAYALAYADALAARTSTAATSVTGLYIRVGNCPLCAYIPSPPIVASGLGYASAGALTGGWANASASSVAAGGNLAVALNLASVDAANIKEAWNGIGFTAAGFGFAQSKSQSGVDLNSIAGVLTAAFAQAGLNTNGSIVPTPNKSSAEAQAAAKAVAKALARTQVLAAIGGHYKAMPGRASVTDILEAGGAAKLKVKCGADVELEVDATATAN